MKATENLRFALENGEIIHVENTGAEFLRYKPEGEYEYRYCYIGTGYTSDWKDQEGVTLEEDGEYPDTVGGMSISNLYVQANSEVNNPLTDPDDFEIIDEQSFRYIYA